MKDSVVNEKTITQFVKTRACANIRSKANKLNLDIPDGVWILPKSFEQLKSLDNFMYPSDYDLVAKLFKQNHIPYSLIHNDRTAYDKLALHS